MEKIICPKCNGNKTIDSYKHVEGGICFCCSGRGFITQDELNQIEKDEIKRMKRQSKKAESDKQKLIDDLKKKWFDNNEVIYIINDKNTYGIKDQITKECGKFNYQFKVWYFPERKEHYNLIQISWTEVLNDNNKGYAVNLIDLIKEKSKGNLKGY